MANITIPQLNLFTGTPQNADVLVYVDSGETETFKIKKSKLGQGVFYDQGNGELFDINPDNGNYQRIRLTADTIVQTSNFSDGYKVSVLVENASAHTFTFIFDNDGKQIYYNGGASTPTPTASGKDIMIFDCLNNEIFITTFANYAP